MKYRYVLDKLGAYCKRKMEKRNGIRAPKTFMKNIWRGKVSDAMGIIRTYPSAISSLKFYEIENAYGIIRKKDEGGAKYFKSLALRRSESMFDYLAGTDRRTGEIEKQTFEDNLVEISRDHVKMLEEMVANNQSGSVESDQHLEKLPDSSGVFGDIEEDDFCEVNGGIGFFDTDFLGDDDEDTDFSGIELFRED